MEADAIHPDWRIALEIVGIACIILLLGRWVPGKAFKDFAGGSCTDTVQHLIASPDGKHTVKTFHRVCGGTASPGSDRAGWDLVYLSTGNSNQGYEYTPIADFENIMPRQVTIRWDTPDQVYIRYPRAAKVGDVYAKVLGIRVVLDPELPETPAIPPNP